MSSPLLYRFFARFFGDFMKTMKDDKLSYAAIPATFFWFWVNWKDIRADWWLVLGPLIFGVSFVICQHALAASRAVTKDIEAESQVVTRVLSPVLDSSGNQCEVWSTVTVPRFYRTKLYSVFAVLLVLCLLSCSWAVQQYRAIGVSEQAKRSPTPTASSTQASVPTNAQPAVLPPPKRAPGRASVHTPILQSGMRKPFGPPEEPFPHGDPDKEKVADVQKKLFDMSNAVLREYVSAVARDLRKFDPHWITPIQAERLDYEPYGDAPDANKVLAEEITKRDARLKGYNDRYWDAFYSAFPDLSTLQLEIIKRCPNGIDPTDPELHKWFNVPNMPGSSAARSADYLEELARKCLN